MKSIRISTGRVLGSGSGVVLAILVAIGAVSYRSTTHLIESASLVTHTHKVLENLHVLTSHLYRLESIEGEGSTFIIELPAARTSARAEPAEQQEVAH